MIERYTNLFSSAKKLADMDEDQFLPGVVGDEGEMCVCIKSPIFEYEDFSGGRAIFLELLDSCDKLDFVETKDEMLTMIATVKEG